MHGLFATKGFKEYVKAARRVLKVNWTGAYTRPSPGLYPHQWNWDSAFIAMGNAHYNQKRARQELKSLFAHQWPNGMVPQIVFNPKALGHYFPEPDFWQAPEGRLTSGITMPPIHATACRHIHESARDGGGAKDFLSFMFPRLMAHHRYLYRERDPDGSGLVYIRHPWESGLDNSPAWDEPLKRIRVDGKILPGYERKDLKHGVPVDQRPSDEDYDRYVFLVDLFRRLDYREKAIRKECPFMVKDVLFNSILCRANRDLLIIADLLKQDATEIKDWVERTSSAISNHLWCPRCQQFESLDAVSGRLIHSATAAGFLPLFASAASRGQAQTLFETLDSVAFCALHQGNCFTVPNYDMTREDFDSRNYWRGPVWINMNWMISRGLRGYGYGEKADAMNRDMMQLPMRFGFHEYFDSRTGKGYGSDGFSWTAALFLDLVYEYYSKDKHRFDWLKPRKSNRLNEMKVLNAAGDGGISSSNSVASELMVAMGHLKNRFYDLHRGRVDYEGMKRSVDYRLYQSLAVGLQSFDLNNLFSDEAKLAFWINIYNAMVIHGIVELGIKTSVKEIPNFFKKIGYRISDFPFSPEAIEHGILRANAHPPFEILPVFRRNDPRLDLSLKTMDPRIHFALVCGSRSCAPIRFYDAEKIDEQLHMAAMNFVNSSEVIVLPEKNKIFLSQIFDWYEKDFEGKEGIRRFLLRYLDKDEKWNFIDQNWSGIGMEYLFYDWNLNH
jgi:mannosylglycerate hydrolase MGH1-like protein/uncharacterized protein DUF547